VTKHQACDEMMRADAGLHSDQARWQVGAPCFHLAARPLLPLYFNGMGHGPTFSDDCANCSLCRVKLDPNALIKERYVGILTEKLIQGLWRPNGDIAIRHLKYRAEKWRSVTLDCHSNFHRRPPRLSV
jgi:hypothetical protein